MFIGPTPESCPSLLSCSTSLAKKRPLVQHFSLDFLATFVPTKELVGGSKSSNTMDCFVQEFLRLEASRHRSWLSPVSTDLALERLDGLFSHPIGIRGTDSCC